MLFLAVPCIQYDMEFTQLACVSHTLLAIRVTVVMLRVI